MPKMRLLRRIMTIAACTGAVCMPSPAQAQSSIQGIVRLRQQGNRPPLAHAFVALDTAAGQPAAITRTNSAGQYSFVNVPPGRYAVHAEKPGYRTTLAAGRAASKIMLDCRSGCFEPSADFELIQGAVIAGSVIDAGGQPVHRAAVVLRASAADAPPPRFLRTITDDRGLFRMAGLAAGSYRLTVIPRPNAPAESAERHIEIADGEQHTDLIARLGERGQFRVTGRLAEVPYGDGFRGRLSFEPVGRAGPPLNGIVHPDGSFTLDPAPAGRYLAAYTATSRQTFEQTSSAMGLIDVQGDLTGVLLQPAETATARGEVRFAGARLPARPIVEFISNDGFGSRWSRVSSSGKFQASDLLPGSYRVEARSKGFYVKGVESGSKRHSPKEIQLSSGANELVVIAATDYGQVKGLVRDPRSRDPMPHARVALQGERATLQALADQSGGFLIGEVIPGEYRICAWSDLPSDEVAEESSWDRAGCAGKYIPIDPDSQIEIELSAAP